MTFVWERGDWNDPEIVRHVLKSEKIPDRANIHTCPVCGEITDIDNKMINFSDGEICERCFNGGWCYES